MGMNVGLMADKTKYLVVPPTVVLGGVGRGALEARHERQHEALHALHAGRAVLQRRIILHQPEHLPVRCSRYH